MEFCETCNKKYTNEFGKGLLVCDLQNNAFAPYLMNTVQIFVTELFRFISSLYQKTLLKASVVIFYRLCYHTSFSILC